MLSILPGNAHGDYLEGTSGIGIWGSQKVEHTRPAGNSAEFLHGGSPIVANDSRKQQPISVASIEGWKMRQANERPAASAEGRLAKEEVRRLSRAQKQAALLRLILSDSVAEKDLEAMIQAAGSLAPEGGG